MRPTHLALWPAIALVALLSTPGYYTAQPPGGKPKPPPDEFRALVKEVEEAYKAPFEVDKDILDELRKQYKNPTPEREGKIFREIRRLYNLPPGQEQDIVRELRLAYELRTPDQEARVFDVVRRGGRLPEGTVPLDVQTEQSGKLFRNFDRDQDGRLDSDEMPETLRGQWQQWDRNRDGSIDYAEYADYYRAHLRSVSERVAAGEIPIKLPKGASLPPQANQFPPQFTAPHFAPLEPSPRDQGAGRPDKSQPKLPDWFAACDADGDGQVSLAEWRRNGRPLEEFASMDPDGDFLITPREMLRFLAGQAIRPAPVAEDEY